MRCDADLLWTLVQQDNEPDEKADAIARHLETCWTCREKLAEIGGQTHWWEEAKQWLADDAVSDTHVEPFPIPAADLSFLDDPVHPEMLGRIGRYDVEALIGRGGMGVVLRAYDSDLHRSVAIKVMAPEWAASTPARRRFAREAQAAASVAHENVVPIYNVEAEAKQPFLVMQYVPGMTLQSWVRTHGPLDPATILRVAGQLAEGLSAAHRRGLVHRDVKPGNVLVGENIDRVWITDFGLARAADSITLTRTGVIAGTPHYMSPEQVRGEPIDHRSDLFSLGSAPTKQQSGSLHPDTTANKNLSPQQPVSAYIVRASQQIESAVAIDELRFQRQVNEITNEIQRLSQPAAPIGVSDITDGDLTWRQSIQEIQRLINDQHE